MKKFKLMAPFRGYGINVVNLAGLFGGISPFAYPFIIKWIGDKPVICIAFSLTILLLGVIIGFFIVNRLNKQEKELIAQAPPTQWQKGGKTESETIRKHFKRHFKDEDIEYTIFEVKETYETVFRIYTGTRRLTYVKYLHNIYTPEGRFSLRDKTGNHEAVTHIKVIRCGKWIMYECLDSAGNAVC